MDRRRNPAADATFGPVCDFALFGAGTRARCRRGRLTLSRVLGGFLLYAQVDVRSSVHRRTFSNPRVGFPALLMAGGSHDRRERGCSRPSDQAAPPYIHHAAASVVRDGLAHLPDAVLVLVE